jgi:hypothetical protein
LGGRPHAGAVTGAAPDGGTRLVWSVPLP